MDVDSPALGVQAIDLQRSLLTEDLQLIDEFRPAIVPAGKAGDVGPRSPPLH